FKKHQRPEEFKELNALLTKDEFRRAYLSARDAYYTPKLVIDSLVFNPKSQEVLEKMNAEKRASLVDESKEQGVKGNTKSHDEIEPATEQVIEKEIEKRAEIIYSKEVATTNNVYYYENEQEVEITKSRGRR
ncbi:hypothetical protein, partial [Helicobacter pylori]|uniref:hypothetical protein n=1 Tax=Helicobacter pylori TaxID=210 RepID=UPI001F09540C